MHSESTYKLWPVLVTAMFGSFMNPFMLSAVNIGLPAIQTNFNCSTTNLSWVTNAFLLANAIVLLPASRAADLIGRVKFFRWGLYLFTFFSILSALSTNLPFLLTTRVFQGAGAALMHVTGMALVTEAYPANKRGMAIGMNITAVYTGLSLGPFIGGFLTQLGGWQLIFWSIVPMGVFTIALSHFNFKHLIKASKSLIKFDYTGTIIYSLAVFFVVYGGGKIRANWGISMFTVGVALMFYFFFVEKNRINPILNVLLLKNNKAFTFANMSSLIHYSATFAIGFLLSLYLQYAKGLSPRDAGLVLVIQPIIMAVIAPLTGLLSDKFNAGQIASIGLLFTLAGLIGLIFLTSSTSIPYLTTILILLGLGFGFFTSPNTNAIMSAVEKKDYGIASGINATMRVFGQTFSMMLVTIFISIYLGKAQLGVENIELFMQSMKISFLIFAVLCIPAIWLSLQRNNIQQLKMK